VAFLLPFVGAVGVAAVTWGLIEAQAVEFRERHVPIPDLPPDLVGLRIGHLSDFHLGAPGGNTSAAERAVDLLMEARPDLVAITGDLMSHPRGAAALRTLCARLEAPLGVVACLGNHDVGEVRDPFSQSGGLPPADELGITVLRDETVLLERAGTAISVTGVEPVRPAESCGAPAPPAPPAAGLHLTLSHYPELFDRVDLPSPNLVLAGHLHGGQICVPLPSGRLRLSQRGRRYTEGIYRRDGMTMHVSRGTGTTFVPLRILARPESTLLILAREE
jgi:predicted MPP superfamily phosphohydrolase